MHAVARLVTVLSLTAALVAAPVAAAGTTTAQAAPVDLLCVGTETTTYTPGLTLATRQTALSGQDTLLTCTSSDPTITSGTGTFTGGGGLSCLGGSATGSFVFTWSNGNHSTVTFATAVVTRPLGNMVLTTTGVVVDGQFEGDTLLNTVTLVNDEVLPTDCLTPRGVTSASGPVTVTFLGR